MKKFAVSLFIDFRTDLKTVVVLANSINDIKTEADIPTSKLMKALDLNCDPEDVYVDAICIDGDDMPSPYILK